MNAFNISYRKVGGLHFLKLGRITLMFCVSKPRAKTVARVLTPAAPFRMSADGVLVLGYADEA